MHRLSTTPAFVLVFALLALTPVSVEEPIETLETATYDLEWEVTSREISEPQTQRPASSEHLAGVTTRISREP